MYHDRHGDACSRLLDTIVMYRDRAVHVTGITERALKVKGTVILTGENISVHQKDEELSLACPPLGYINAETGALYFMRQPMRRWKQGVDMRALVCPHEGIRGRGLLTHRLIAKCLENDYPDFSQATQGFRSLNPFREVEKRGVAFSKHFSVRNGGRGMLLCYKGREVGVVENRTPILSTEYQWLQELLEAEL